LSHIIIIIIIIIIRVIRVIASNLFVITPQVIPITGVKIVNYCSPLYFANAEIFRQRVIKKVEFIKHDLFCSIQG